MTSITLLPFYKSNTLMCLSRAFHIRYPTNRQFLVKMLIQCFPSFFRIRCLSLLAKKLLLLAKQSMKRILFDGFKTDAKSQTQKESSVPLKVYYNKSGPPIWPTKLLDTLGEPFFYAVHVILVEQSITSLNKELLT